MEEQGFFVFVRETCALLLGATVEVTVMALLEEQGVLTGETRAVLPPTPEPELEPEFEPELELDPEPELGLTGELLGLPEGDN